MKKSFLNKIVYYNNIITLILLIISAIFGIWIAPMLGYGNILNYGYFIYFILFTILLCDKKINKKTLILSIVSYLILLIESFIKFTSIFNLFFIVISLFGTIISLLILSNKKDLYLNKVETNNNITNNNDGNALSIIGTIWLIIISLIIIIHEVDHELLWITSVNFCLCIPGSIMSIIAILKYKKTNLKTRKIFHKLNIILFIFVNGSFIFAILYSILNLLI